MYLKRILFIIVAIISTSLTMAPSAGAQSKEVSPATIVSGFTGQAHFLPTHHPLDVFLRIQGRIENSYEMGTIRILALGEPTPWGAIILRRSGVRIDLPNQSLTHGVIYLYSSNLIQGYFPRSGYGFALTLRPAGGFNLAGTLIIQESLDPTHKIKPWKI